MATDVSHSTSRALLIPDLRLGVDSFTRTGSTYNTAGPLPGVPEAQQETEMTLEATGKEAQNVSMRVRMVKAGMPRLGGALSTWRYGASEDYRGWDPPQTITGFETLNYTTTVNTWAHPHIIRLQSDGLVIAVRKNADRVVAWTRAYGATTWTESGPIFTNGSYTLTDAGGPALCQLPSGRLLVFMQDEVSATEMQIRMSYSDDDGATWTTGSKSCLADSILFADYQPSRMRAAYLNGQIMLLVQVLDTVGANDRNRIQQYASSDFGATFTLVSTTTVDYTAGIAGYVTNKAFVELSVVSEQFLVTYLSERDGGAFASAITPYRRVLANALLSLDAAFEDIAVDSLDVMEWGVRAATAGITTGDLATWLDEDGRVYMAGRDHDTAGGALSECHTQYSDDGGVTWQFPGASSSPGLGAAFWFGHDAAKYPSAFAICEQGGRAVMVHSFTSDTDNHDPSLMVTCIGGYSTVTLPNMVGKSTAQENRISWEFTYLPFYLPDAVAAVWTLVVANAPVITLDAGTLKIADGGAGTSTAEYTNAAMATTMARGVIALIDGLCTTTTVGAGAHSKIRWGDATGSYKVRVRYSSQDGIVLTDLVAGAQIAADTTAAAKAAAQTGVQILMHGNNPGTGAPGNDGYVSAWWRAVPTGSEGDHKWTLLGSSTTLQLEAVAFAQAEVKFGILAGASTVARFKIHGASSQEFAGEGLTAFSNPGDLIGRSVAATPVFVDSGTRINATDGPAFVGDIWHIDTRHQHDIENIHPDVSATPRRGWRSLDETQQELIWVYDSTLDQDTRVLGGSLSLYLGEINFKTSELWSYDKASTTWIKLADIDTSIGQTALCFSRKGDLVQPSASQPGTPGEVWYTYNILANSYVQLKLTGDGGSTVIRKIVTNSEGAWRQDTGATKLAKITLEGVLSTDPVGDTGATNMQIWGKDVLVVVNNPTKFTRLKLVIPAQDTYEGYFKIGVRVIGHVAWFARQYSWGRILEHAANNEVTEGRSGTRRVRNLGPMRRSVQLAWVDGIDVSGATQKNPVADYITAYTGSTVPVASPADTPYLVAGISEQLQGATQICVYIPTYARAANGTTPFVQTNRNNMLLVRLVTSPRLESILGEEWGSPGEVFQVATTTWEEEV